MCVCLCVCVCAGMCGGGGGCGRVGGVGKGGLLEMRWHWLYYKVSNKATRARAIGGTGIAPAVVLHCTSCSVALHQL